MSRGVAVLAWLHECFSLAGLLGLYLVQGLGQ